MKRKLHQYREGFTPAGMRCVTCGGRKGDVSHSTAPTAVKPKPKFNVGDRVVYIGPDQHRAGWMGTVTGVDRSAGIARAASSPLPAEQWIVRYDESEATYYELPDTLRSELKVPTFRSVEEADAWLVQQEQKRERDALRAAIEASPTGRAVNAFKSWVEPDGEPYVWFRFTDGREFTKRAADLNEEELGGIGVFTGAIKVKAKAPRLTDFRIGSGAFTARIDGGAVAHVLQRLGGGPYITINPGYRTIVSFSSAAELQFITNQCARLGLHCEANYTAATVPNVITQIIAPSVTSGSTLTWTVGPITTTSS